ncbi:MAG: carboxypeptidase-like regulatory domain-containing protein, partial [Bacteroidota bacterium]
MKHLLRFCLLLLSVCVGLQAHAQEITVTGQVTDQNGESLPGVYILIKGSTQGTVTDYDGKFSITADANATLVAQFLGYSSQEIPIGNQSTINIQMTEQAQDLDEIVVTGLGTSVKRSNLANAIATVSAKDLTGTTTPSTLDGGLYGKLPGANIVQSSGAPGGGIAIRLRGVSSIVGQNQPLFIIDGVYVDNSEVPNGLRDASGANSGSEENSSNRIADIDPADIENIEILKGPSAAAIYGTRANAGVIIITTKRGKSGRTRINFAQDVGFSTIIENIGVRQFTADEVANEFGAADLAEFQANGLIDYEDEIFGETGLVLNTRLSITGGNQKTSFFIGGGYR